MVLIKSIIIMCILYIILYTLWSYLEWVEYEYLMFDKKVKNMIEDGLYESNIDLIIKVYEKKRWNSSLNKIGIYLPMCSRVWSDYFSIVRFKTIYNIEVIKAKYNI